MEMVLYRYNDQEDLEILMVEDEHGMAFPESAFYSSDEFEASTGIPAAHNEDVIELDSSEKHLSRGNLARRVIALEGKMEKKMRKFLHIREEEGNYVALKEVTKKVLPHQYTILKELKDVLMERNITKYL